MFLNGVLKTGREALDCGNGIFNHDLHPKQNIASLIATAPMQAVFLPI